MDGLFTAERKGMCLWNLAAINMCALNSCVYTCVRVCVWICVLLLDEMHRLLSVDIPPGLAGTGHLDRLSVSFTSISLHPPLFPLLTLSIPLFPPPHPPIPAWWVLLFTAAVNCGHVVSPAHPSLLASLPTGGKQSQSHSIMTKWTPFLFTFIWTFTKHHRSRLGTF